MNKINILLVLTYGLAFINIMGLFWVIFELDDSQSYLLDENIVNKFDFIFSLFIQLLLVIALIIISIGLTQISRIGFFSSVFNKHFNIGGLLFMFIGISDILYVLVKLTRVQNPEMLISPVIINILLLILGLISFIFSDVLKKSSSIKKENDLTI
jgi:hypothetical protein